MWWLWPRSREYAQVPKDQQTWDASQEAASTKKSNYAAGIVLVVLCFIAGISGYVLTHLVARQSTSEWTSQALELQNVHHTFHYDRNFSYPPNTTTDEAWRDIFPEHGGFFVHPQNAPARSTFSVFHTLHCLYGLRGAYWANVQAAEEGRQLRDEDLPMDNRQSHMRHCIDLLRQSLMCQADTTLEVVDEAIQGVHGFKTAHLCKDWEQLKQWTSEQQRKELLARR